VVTSLREVAALVSPSGSSTIHGRSRFPATSRSEVTT